MNLSAILVYLQAITEVAALVPSPAQPFAALALQLNKITQAAIKAQAASEGKTVEEVIAGLHRLEPIP